jgi:exodeoxyribonuclease VII small subunit
MAKIDNTIAHFERNLDQLKQCVQTLENPEQLKLQDLINLYQKGLKMANACQIALDNTNQMIQTLKTQQPMQTEQLEPLNSQQANESAE